jgi:alpha-L-rhamnosidase
MLFEHGDGPLAVKLMCSEHDTSYAGMRRLGATTLWEYWPGSLKDRSHNHPMFGAVVGYFYDYLLGIRPECAGYSQVVVSPAIVSQINEISGYRQVPGGKLEVSYQKHDGQIDLCINVPEGVQATLDICGTKMPLQQGIQSLRFTL